MRSPPLALLALTLFALGPSACRRRHRAPPPYSGPALGAANATMRVARWVERPRSSVQSPFTLVVRAAERSFGVSAGKVYSLNNPGDSLAVGADAVAGFTEDERAIALTTRPLAEGRRACALFNSTRPFIACERGDRSGGGPSSWDRTDAVASEPLPELPQMGAVPAEITPGLSATADAIAFWLGESAAISRDGRTFTALETHATIRSAAVTNAGSFVAIARLNEEPNEPFGVLRVDAAGVRTITAFPHSDACAPGKIYRLADGALLLGSDRGLLGQCARISTDDGVTFTDFAASLGRSTRAVYATAAGKLLVLSDDPLPETAVVQGVAVTRIDSRLDGLPHDVAPDDRAALGLSDGLAEGPLSPALFAEAARDVRSTLAFAAGRDVIATLDPRGTVTVVEPVADGAFRVRRSQSPCRFPLNTPPLRDFPMLATDSEGTLCCTSLPGPHNLRGAAQAACANLRDETLQWSSVSEAPNAVGSGDGAIAFFGRAAHCVDHGDASAKRDVGLRVGISANYLVREMSCSASGSVIAAGHPGSVGLGSPFPIRAAGARSNARRLFDVSGFNTHLFARRDGTFLTAHEGAGSLIVQRWRAGVPNAITRWHSTAAADPPSFMAPWDARSTVLTLRTSLVVIGPFGARQRAFESHRFEAVARLGDALVGATRDGRFAVLQPSP